ncbi:MAG: hypothetical protein JWQ09_2969 [Segetibacter sp.]|nr:hypothetical protein [Segetibacter sp.]
METNLAPLAMPCKKITHDGYPNLPENELEKVPIKDLKWFVNQIGSFVFVASHSYKGIVQIDDHGQARQFYNNQYEGYSFLTLADRIKQSVGQVHFNQELGYLEPELEKIYLLTIYINGKLQESHPVVYSGFTHNLKWYIFNFINGTDNAGNSCRLLKVGYFPTYQNSFNPEAVVFEQYFLIS